MSQEFTNEHLVAHALPLAFAHLVQKLDDPATAILEDHRFEALLRFQQPLTNSLDECYVQIVMLSDFSLKIMHIHNGNSRFFQGAGKITAGSSTKKSFFA